MNIVITGSSKGIGKAIAQKFASHGYSVFLCARNEAALSALAAELKDQYPTVNVQFKVCDVSQKAEVKAFADWVLQQTDFPTILVNNAGIYLPGHVHTEKDGVLEQLMETNVYSAYYLSRYLLPAMMKVRAGHIFNICSIASLQAYHYGGSYSITKHAMKGLSANLRHELKQFGIKVTSVFPGAAYTDSWNASDVSPDRIMTADDIADMVFASSQLSPQACVEEIVIRPQLGDL